MRLAIRLARVEPRPASTYRTPSGKPAPLPARMAWLHPDALASLVDSDLLGHVVLSDCYRSLDASRQAFLDWRAGRKRARPARPGESGHNYGVCLDLDTAATIRRLRCADKLALDRVMAGAGWRVYRRTGEESWHYTWTGTTDPDLALADYRYADIQARLDELYPLRRGFDRTPSASVQAASEALLAEAGYNTQAAFCAAYLLPRGTAAWRAWRVLLAVTAVEDRA